MRVLSPGCLGQELGPVRNEEAYLFLRKACIPVIGFAHVFLLNCQNLLVGLCFVMKNNLLTFFMKW